MKKIPTDLEKKVREYLLNDFNDYIDLEDILDSTSKCAYIEFDDYTLDVEFTGNLELEVLNGDYYNSSEAYYKGYLDVYDIRIYTEDEEYNLEITKDLEKTLNIKY